MSQHDEWMRVEPAVHHHHYVLGSLLMVAIGLLLLMLWKLFANARLLKAIKRSQLFHSMTGGLSQTHIASSSRFVPAAIFEALIDALILAGVHIAVTDQQAQFCSVFSGIVPLLPDDNVIGKRGDEVCSSEGQQELTRIRRATIHTGSATVSIVENIKGLGGYLGSTDSHMPRTCRVAVSPIRERKDGLMVNTGAVSVSIDIHGQRTAERDLQQKVEELTQAREVAEKAAMSKADFLSVMSHEIRTPLNGKIFRVPIMQAGVAGVIGMAQLMTATELNPQQAECLDVIMRSGRVLLRTINNILDFSKIEAGKFTLDERPFSIASIVKDVVDALRSRVEERQNRMLVDIQSDTPPVVIGDSDRLFQILLNIVGNACKFTSAGQIKITVYAFAPAARGIKIKTATETIAVGSAEGLRVSNSDEPGGRSQLDALNVTDVRIESAGVRMKADSAHSLSVSTCADEQGVIEAIASQQKSSTSTTPVRVRFEVRDTGPGIPKAALPGLFKPFSQADQSTTRMYGGTGLGLAICKKLVEMMNGEIGVESTEGKGSLFWFCIPLCPTTQEPSRALPLFSITQSPVVRPRSASAPAAPSTITDSARSSANSLLAAEKAEENSLPAHPSAQSLLAAEETSMTQKAKLVLVAEDNLVNQKVLINMLKRLGYNSEVVGDGQKAVGAVRDGHARYSAILMDAQMPIMDGEEATRRIREFEDSNKLSRLTIIAVTADALPGSREKMIKSGMNDYSAKPIALDDLKDVLGRNGV